MKMKEFTSKPEHKVALHSTGCTTVLAFYSFFFLIDIFQVWVSKDFYTFFLQNPCKILGIALCACKPNTEA